MAIETLWTHSLPSRGRSCAILKDTAIFLTEDSVLAYAYTGVRSWGVQYEPTFPRVATSGDVVAVPVASGIALLSSLGAQIRRLPVDGAITSLNGGIAVAATTEDRVLSITRSGRVAWEQGGLDRPVGASTSDEGVLVALSDAVLCLGEAGDVLWRSESEGPLEGICGGRRPLVWSRRQLTAFGHGGTADWMKELDKDIVTVKSDRTVAVLTADGIDVLSPDGRLLQHLSGSFVDVAARGDSILAVGDEEGTLFEDLEGKEVFYEVLCMDAGRCGTFVSATSIDVCPKCGGGKTMVRVVRAEAAAAWGRR